MKPSLTKPRLVAALEWSKTKAAVSLSSNCTAASENSRREHAVNQPEMNPGRKREGRGWMASLTKRRRRDSVNERKVEGTASLSSEHVYRIGVQD